MKTKKKYEFKKPRWADGSEFEVKYSPEQMTFLLRWPEWAHKFTLAGGKDLIEDGIMDQLKALWLGYCPCDWDLVGTIYAQRVPFSMPELS